MFIFKGVEGEEWSIIILASRRGDYFHFVPWLFRRSLRVRLTNSFELLHARQTRPLGAAAAPRNSRLETANLPLLPLVAPPSAIFNDLGLPSISIISSRSSSYSLTVTSTSRSVKL